MTIHDYRVPIDRFKLTKHIQLMMLSQISEIGDDVESQLMMLNLN